MICNNFGSCIGNKFDNEGTPLKFKGNTFISLLDSNSQVYSQVINIKNEIEQLGLTDSIRILPNSSLHMTVIEGVCDQVRKTEYWTSFFPLDAPLKEIDEYFEKQWQSISPFFECYMQFEKIICNSGIVISLKPSKKEYSDNINNFRKIISEKMGLKFPDFDTYGFHISIAYGLKKPNQDQLIKLENYLHTFEKKYFNNKFVFKVPQPSLTFFNDMFYFSKERFDK